MVPDIPEDSGPVNDKAPLVPFWLPSAPNHGPRMASWQDSSWKRVPFGQKMRPSRNAFSGIEASFLATTLGVFLEPSVDPPLLP